LGLYTIASNFDACGSPVTQVADAAAGDQDIRCLKPIAPAQRNQGREADERGCDDVIARRQFRASDVDQRLGRREIPAFRSCGRKEHFGDDDGEIAVDQDFVEFERIAERGGDDKPRRLPAPWPSPGVAVIALIGDPAGPSSMRPNGQRGGRGVAGHEVRTNLNSQLVRTALSCSIRWVRCNVQ
jgi:hypothetical protein